MTHQCAASFILSILKFLIAIKEKKQKVQVLKVLFKPPTTKLSAFFKSYGNLSPLSSAA